MLTIQTKRLTAGYLTLALTLFLAGCGAESELSEEDKVRATLTAIEVAAEARSLSGMIEHVSDSYRDFEGNDTQKIKALLQLQLIKNQSINIFSNIRELEVSADSATVELSVAMASRGSDLSIEENRLRADTHRFSILLKREKEQWKIRSASWQRGW